MPSVCATPVTSYIDDGSVLTGSDRTGIVVHRHEPDAVANAGKFFHSKSSVLQIDRLEKSSE
ncbi:MAG: hypothetical protein SGI77_22860 [Pirellulaceae bacterium]|nr:hypothetical protein [Pirellulaceae bacterium]